MSYPFLLLSFIIALSLCEVEYKTENKPWLNDIDDTICTLKDSDGKTALMIASELGHSELIKLILKKDCNVDIQDNLGKTALFYSAENGWPISTHLLLQKGANPNLKNNEGWTPLTYCIYKYGGITHEYSVISLMLNHGGNTDDMRLTYLNPKIQKLLDEHKKIRSLDEMLKQSYHGEISTETELSHVDEQEPQTTLDIMVCSLYNLIQRSSMAYDLFRNDNTNQ